jgi:hypothetical protein
MAQTAVTTKDKTWHKQAAVKPLEEYSSKELEAFLKSRKEAEQRRASEDGVRIRKEVEGYVLETYNLTLAQIFTATDKEPVSYKCHLTGKLWSGKGRRPEGLRNLKPKELEKYALPEGCAGDDVIWDGNSECWVAGD